MTLEMEWISERVAGHPEKYYASPEDWANSPVLSDVTEKEMGMFMREFRAELARARKDLKSFAAPTKPDVAAYWQMIKGARSV